MDSSLFNPQTTTETNNPDISFIAVQTPAHQIASDAQSDTNSLIQNGIHANIDFHGSASTAATNSHPESEQQMFENYCSPLASSVPLETDHAYHFLAKIGLETSPNTHVHKNVPHQKPCQKISIKLHENPSRPLEQSQIGRNSDPFNFLNCIDMFSHQDVKVIVSHETLLSTSVTPAVPRPLRKPLVEEKLETVSTQTNINIIESPQKQASETPNLSTVHRETPMSTNHTAMEFTPMHTPHHLDDFAEPLDQDNLRRSSITTDKTSDSRRDSSVIEEMRGKPGNLILFNNNNLNTEKMGKPDGASKERYRQTSLQIMQENKGPQRCVCNIF